MSDYNDDATVGSWSMDGTEWNAMSSVIDSSKGFINALTATTTQLNYLSTSTSDVQTQISGLEDKQYIFASDTANSILITTDWTDITLDTTEIITSDFTHSNGVITINTTGVYSVTYNISAINILGLDRTGVYTRLMVDTGSGFVEETASRSSMYCRTYVDVGVGSTSLTKVMSLDAEDELKLQAYIYYGEESVTTLDSSCGISIIKVD